MPWLDWLAGSWTLPKGLGQGLESLGDFWSLANGTPERPKKYRMSWLDWLVALPKGVWKSFGHGWTGSWTLPKGLAEGLESLGDFWSLANGTLERPKK